MLATTLATIGCLFFANIASVFMVQAENRSRPVAAGVFEALYALFWIVATKFAIGNLDFTKSHATQAVITIMAVVIGNFFGAYVGTKLGDRFLHDEDEKLTLARIDEAEAGLLMAEHALHELHQEIELHHEVEGDHL